jgi:hypothetical protein
MMTSSADTMMICPVCRLGGGPFHVDEAALHLATHNRFHHAGAPIAVACGSVHGGDNLVAA